MWLARVGYGSRDYVDFAGGIAVTALGHAHPELLKVLHEQGDKLWHIGNGYTNAPVLRLAKRLTDLTFADRAFFANSGAEANEAGLKLARRVAIDNHGEDKIEIISFTQSFHGRTFFTVSVGGQPKYAEGFGSRPEGIRHLVQRFAQSARSHRSEYVRGDRRAGAGRRRRDSRRSRVP